MPSIIALVSWNSTSTVEAKNMYKQIVSRLDQVLNYSIQVDLSQVELFGFNVNY